MIQRSNALPWISTLIAISILAPASAKVKVWHHYQTSDYSDAQLKQVTVSNEGVLRLSRRLERLPGIDVAHVWDLAEDSKGNLYVATGGEGKLYRVSPAGKVSLAYTSPDSQILCVISGADGSIYAGTGPTGTIVRINPQGKRSIVAENLGEYVWSMVLDGRNGTIYAGTGPKGRIYEVPTNGKPTVFYRTKQNHVLSVARDTKGMLYAGTDKNGMVYRIDPRGKGFVLYSAKQSEIRSLLVTPAGIYAGTSSPDGPGSSSSRVASSSESFSPMDSTKIIRTSAKKGKSAAKITKAVKTSSSSSDSSEDSSRTSRGKPAPTLPPPAAGENSLYRIARDGTVKELFREKAMILTVLRQHGRLLAGTGMKGQLFEINEQTKEKTEIARLDNGQIHCLLQRRDGSIVVGTGDPGRIYVLKNDYTHQGTVLSDVLDAKLLSKWGAASWRMQKPHGTSISIAFRSGNVALPDDTWSDWSEEQIDPNSARIACPTARFLQYRLTLKTKNPRHTPAIRSVVLRYATINHAPEINKIEVPDLISKNLENPKRLTIRWKATDPNEDELTYSVFVRKEGWKNWVRLKEDLSKREFEWDSATMPSGMYRVKVVASDHRDNPQPDALTSQRTSPAFPVSHQPPKVSVRILAVEKDHVLVEAKANDPMVRLTRAEYALNGKRWENVFPEDGLFDSKTETMRFRLGRLREGNYVLVLRVRNAAGNTGTADAVFRIERAEK